jgi:hypothetical protein
VEEEKEEAKQQHPSFSAVRDIDAITAISLSRGTRSLEECMEEKRNLEEEESQKRERGEQGSKTKSIH